MSPTAPIGKKKALVIGAGLAGVTTAYELARRNFHVSVIDSNDSPALGASYANGGMLTPSMPDPWNSPGVAGHLWNSLFDPRSSLLLRYKAIPSLTNWGIKFIRNSTPTKYNSATLANFDLCAYSLMKTREWRDFLELKYNSSDLGTLKVFREKRAISASLKISEMLRDRGLEFTVLSKDETIDLEPSLSPVRGKIASSIFYSGDSIGNAREFVEHLARHCAELGVEFRFNETVHHLLRNNKRVLGAQTDRALHHAEIVVVCAGHYSPDIVKELGISLPVKPAKGYSVTFLSPSSSGPTRAVIDDAMHAAIVPIGGKIRVVGTAEFTGRDAKIDPVRIDNLMRLYRDLFPNDDQEQINDAEEWAGFRPMSADGLPSIGATKMHNLFLNTGHGHLGWTMATGSAVLVADLITGTECDISPSPYDPNRHEE